MMENNKSNQKGSYDSKKEVYDQLWLELEPRLKKPKKSRGFILFWGFALLMTASYFVYQFNGSKVGDFAEKQINTTINSKVSTPKQTIEEEAQIESVDNASEDIEPIVLSTKENVALPINSLSINDAQKKEVTEFFPSSSPISSSSINAVQEKEITEVPSIYSPSSLPINQSPIYELFSPLIKPVFKVPIIKLVPLAHLSKKKINISLRGIERDNQLEDRRNLSFGLNSSFLFYSNKKSKAQDQYTNELNNSLNVDKGFELSLSSWYEVNPNIELGLAISYLNLFEVFRLQNSVETKSHILNTQAFLYDGSYISANQCITTTVHQNVQNNNSYQYVSLVPSFNYKLGLHNWQVRFGASVPIIVHQKYSGTLFNEEKLIIHDGSVFESNRFNMFGIQFSNSIHYTLKNSAEIGINLSYRNFFSGSNSSSNSWQNSLSTFGLGLDLRQRF